VARMSDAQSVAEPGSGLGDEEVDAGIEVSLILLPESRSLVQQLNLGTQVEDSFTYSQRLLHRQVRASRLYRPGRRRRVDDFYVVFPRACAARPQPEILAGFRHWLCLTDYGAQGAIVCLPDVESPRQVLAQRGNTGPRKCWGLCRRADGDVGERLEGPATGDPPAAALPPKQLAASCGVRARQGPYGRTISSWSSTC
jgi:hypothetical protein